MTNTDEEFIAFVEDRSPELQLIALHLTGNHEDAQDLCQLTLERAYRHWGRLRADEDPFGYVRQILINAFRDGRRRTNRLHRLVGRQVSQPAQMADAAAETLDDQLLDRIDITALLARLTDRERAVVVLRFLEDLSEAETARMLGLSTGTVKSATHRALTKLRIAAPVR